MPGTRLFFIGCTLFAAVVVIVMVAAVPSVALPDAAARGLRVWQAHDCAGCHGLYGYGGLYGPDLTHNAGQRGAAYLTEFLENPGAFYPDAIRIMPRFSLTQDETADLIALLTWVSESPQAAMIRPVRVSGFPVGFPAAGSMTAVLPAAAEASTAPVTDPVARGQALFGRAPGNCATCHSLEPEIRIIGPSLAGIALRAADRVPGQSAEAYLRASMLRPGEYLVDGYQNVMAQNLGALLAADEVDDLIAFLLTLDQAE